MIFILFHFPNQQQIQSWFRSLTFFFVFYFFLLKNIFPVNIELKKITRSHQIRFSHLHIMYWENCIPSIRDVIRRNVCNTTDGWLVVSEMWLIRWNYTLENCFLIDCSVHMISYRLGVGYSQDIPLHPKNSHSSSPTTKMGKHLCSHLFGAY